jgi:hypothetical protein
MTTGVSVSQTNKKIRNELRALCVVEAYTPDGSFRELKVFAFLHYGPIIVAAGVMPDGTIAAWSIDAITGCNFISCLAVIC